MCPLQKTVAGAFALLVIAGTHFKTSGQEQAKQQSDTDEMADVLQKRHAVLSQLLELQTASFRKGNTQIDDVFQAHRQLQHIELELAVTNKDRIQRLEKSVRMAADLEKIVEAKYEAGKTSLVDLLKARAENLRIQADLLRERERAKVTAYKGKPSHICPMHPKIVDGVPGRCPICAMTLVKVKDADAVNRPTDEKRRGTAGHRHDQRETPNKNIQPLDASQHVEEPDGRQRGFDSSTEEPGLKCL